MAVLDQTNLLMLCPHANSNTCKQSVDLDIRISHRAIFP